MRASRHHQASTFRWEKTHLRESFEAVWISADSTLQHLRIILCYSRRWRGPRKCVWSPPNWSEGTTDFWIPQIKQTNSNIWIVPRHSSFTNWDASKVAKTYRSQLSKRGQTQDEQDQCTWVYIDDWLCKLYAKLSRAWPQVKSYKVKYCLNKIEADQKSINCWRFWIPVRSY